MRTLLEILNLSVDYLKGKGIAEPRLQAEELVSQSLGLKRMDLYLQFDRPIITEELERCRSWLLRRGRGEPVQYIRGEVDFFGCVIQVTPAVLIPRQETEILVDKIAKELAEESLSGKVLWDVCCGSACVGIALKKRFPALTVCVSDISPEALAVAKSNARINDVEIEVLQGDLLAPFQGKYADYFVCNPPYISEKEWGALDEEVRAYEPRQALISGESGLEFYKRLSCDLPPHLHSGGKIWFEIGTGQGEAVRKLFNADCWRKWCIEKDWSGHERFFSLEIE